MVVQRQQIRRWVVFTFCTILWLGALLPCFANDDLQAIINGLPEYKLERSIHIRQPLCGVLCLYFWITANDKNIDLRNLIKPEYVGSDEGSNMHELLLAAGKFGVNAQGMKKLTAEAVLAQNNPIILHVKDEVSSTKFNHYILYLKRDAQEALVFDPFRGVIHVPLFELAMKMDGYGIMLAAESGGIRKYLLMSRLTDFCETLLLLSLLLLALVICNRKWVRMPSRLIGLGVNTALAVIPIALVAIFFHVIMPHGFFNQQDYVKSLQESFFSEFLPKISKQEVSRVMGDKDTVFIDARLPEDYKAGHIKDAMSVPVSSSDDEIKKAVKKISDKKRVVIYCQSIGCPFASLVAKRIAAEDKGVNMVLYKGGWKDWSK